MLKEDATEITEITEKVYGSIGDLVNSRRGPSRQLSSASVAIRSNNYSDCRLNLQTGECTLAASLVSFALDAYGTFCNTSPPLPFFCLLRFRKL